MAQNFQIPAHIAKLFEVGSALTDAAVGGITGFPQPPHISIRGQRFTLVDGQGNDEMLRDIEMEVIVVAANPMLSKIYYGRAYDPTATEAAPPKCFSDNGVAPSSNAMEPQHENCAGCPHNVWGSATSQVSQKPTKACSDRKKIAVLYDGELFQLVIPPASMKPFRDHCEALAKVRLPLQGVFTKISFDPKTTGVLTFTAASMITEEDAGKVIKVMSAPELTVQMTGADDKPNTRALPKPDQAIVNPASRDAATVVTVTPPAFDPEAAQRAVRPVEERIINLKPEPTEQKEPPKRRVRKAVEQSTPVAGLHQTSAPNGPAANDTPSFGMTDAPTIDTARLRALLGDAAG